MYASVSGHQPGGGRDHYNKKPRGGRQSRSLYRRLVNLIGRYVTGNKFRSDSELEDFEPEERYRVRDVRSLSEDTNFSPGEVKRIYRGFKVDCPLGVVGEDDFKDIYSRFFPQQYNTNLYAHFVFNTFDTDPTERVINFEEFLKWLSRLCRGSVDEKLRWTFRLYDVNHDGRITRDEMSAVVISVFALLGAAPASSLQNDPAVVSCVDRVFQRMDLNCDGVVTQDEFLNYCTSDHTILESLINVTTVI